MRIEEAWVWHTLVWRDLWKFTNEYFMFCFIVPWITELGYSQLSLKIHSSHGILLWHIILIQECIPVGCVPAARWPYAEVCCPGGGGLPGLGGCLLPGGVCLVVGVSAPGGWGVCLVWGVVSAPGGVCLVWEGVVSAPGGVSLVETPPCEQNDKQV